MSQSYDLTNPVRLKTERSRLGKQASLLFPFESAYLPLNNLLSGACVLDLGCGTGAYLQQIQSLRPDLKLHGADRSEDLLAQARNGSSIDFRSVDLVNQQMLAELVSDLKPQLMILRYVAQHLEKASFQKLLATLQRSKLAEARICVIESWDPLTLVQPSHPLFEQLWTAKQAMQAASGGNRQIAAEIPELARMTDLGVIDRSIFAVTDAQLGKDAWWSIILPILKSAVQNEPLLLEAADGLPGLVDSAQLGISIHTLQ